MRPHFATGDAHYLCCQQLFWNVGSQLVALNWQTMDRPMQVQAVLILPQTLPFCRCPAPLLLLRLPLFVVNCCCR